MTHTHISVKPNVLQLINEDSVITQALHILRRRLEKSGIQLNSTEDAKNYLKLNYGLSRDEIFGVILLDANYHVLRVEELFRGTVDNVTVHTRVIMRAALEANASRVILFHNHPSGKSFASEKDIETTNIICSVLTKIDISVLDHMIICGDEVVSFMEENLEL